MKRKKKGGLSNLAISAIWLLVALGVILAAFQASGATSIDDAMQIAQDRASYYSECIPAGECGLIAIVRDLGNDGPSFTGDSETDNSNGSSNGASNSEESQENSGEQSNTTDDLGTVSREEIGYRGPEHGEPYVNEVGAMTRNSAIIKLNEIRVSESEDVDYDRSEWRHWSGTEGRACWNTREEVLHRDATPGTVVYLDRQLNQTENYDEACAIGRPVEENGRIRINTEDSGSWVTPYNGRTETTSSNIDIDHIVPLNYAARNGGQSWSLELKETFANDLDNLLATSARENRRKGSKGPSEYMPPYRGYQCQYAKSFIGVVHKYDLSMPEEDAETLAETLEDCQI